MSFSAVILAGGKSSRMGCDKAFLEIDGKPLLARQIAVAREAGARDVFISGRADTDYSSFDGLVLQDQFENAGPLAGIERALNALSTPLLLVLAVDLPAMSPEFLRGLFARCDRDLGAIARVAGQIEPLVAFYPKVAAPMAEVRLRDGNKVVSAFAQHCVQSGLASFIDIPADDASYFVNWNAPADVQAAV